MERIESHVSNAWARGAYELRFRCGVAFALPVIFSPADEGAFVEPALMIDQDGAQQLMDELWRAGIRPTEGSGSAGSLAATERHLADMKVIAFSALKSKGITP